MEAIALVRRALIGLVGTAVGVAALAVAARSGEIAASNRAADVTIHDAAETLRDHCRRDAQGRLWLELPGGRRFEMVTSTSDPAIANPGDGAFHPFDVGEVRAALAALRYPTDWLTAEIYLLPFPRRAALQSAATPGLVLLSPGVRRIPREQQHAEVAHEIGHLLQYALMPDSDTARWGAYRRLRGLEDERHYSAAAPHARRPHEIFAEDFRALFGGTLANYSGTIENDALVPPAQVAGLEAFMRSLLEGPPASLVLSAWPNPSRQGLTFTRAGGATTLELFDLAGRRVATLDPVPWGRGVRWNWDRRDASGRRVGPGVLLARPGDGQGKVIRVTLLP